MTSQITITVQVTLCIVDPVNMNKYQFVQLKGQQTVKGSFHGIMLSKCKVSERGLKRL